MTLALSVCGMLLSSVGESDFVTLTDQQADEKFLFPSTFHVIAFL